MAAKTDTTRGDSAKKAKAVEDQYGTRRLLTTRHNFSYNFAADSLNFSDISSSFGLQILPDYMFTINTRHSFYHKYDLNPNKVKFPELTYWGYELSKNFHWSGTFNGGLPSQLEKYEMLNWSLSLDYRYSFSSTRVRASNSSCKSFKSISERFNMFSSSSIFSA